MGLGARGISVTCDWAFLKSVICQKAENKSVTCDRGIVFSVPFSVIVIEASGKSVIIEFESL